MNAPTVVLPVTQPGLTGDTAAACSPVLDPGPEELDPGMALCLSGGGYRAMLFHLGTLWRLNELGILSQLKRISSVSGGSITAGQLGLQWSKLDWQNGIAQDFVQKIVDPIRKLASHTLDEKAIFGGILNPGKSISEEVAEAYSKYLYGNATLQDLPDDEIAAKPAPRFVINATSVQSGVLVRFSRKYMADYRVGTYPNPTIPLAFAVAASSAFPPVLSPAKIKLPDGAVKDQAGTDLHREPYTTHLVLTDGGVYDNLGLETVWKKFKIVLVSDGGGQFEAEDDPAGNWAGHALRINTLIDSQVRALRKRQVVGSYERKEREGSYWRMRADITKYPAAKTLPCPLDRTTKLANTPTRLKAMDNALQERLINWGYALTDAAIRGHVQPQHAAPTDFPYPASKV
jgi:NTE family protein